MGRKVSPQELMTLVQEGATVERESAIDTLGETLATMLANQQASMERQEVMMAQIVSAVSDIKVEAGEVDLSPLDRLVDAIQPQAHERVPYRFNIERDQRGIKSVDAIPIERVIN